MAELLLRGQSIGTFKGVLFDKDGTLSHSEPQLVKLADDRIDQALERWKGRSQSGLSGRELEQRLRRAFGRLADGLDPAGTLAVAARRDNLTSMATVLCLEGCSWPEAIEIATGSFDAIDQCTPEVSTVSELLPGADALLEALDQAGMTLAVISNDTAAGIAQFLASHGLRQRIRAIWSADDTPTKPDPGAVDGLCEQLGLQPDDCVLIGDAETDLTMAKAAGIGVVLGFRGGWAASPQLPSADHQIDRWSELTLKAAA